MEKQIRQLIETRPPGLYALCTVRASDEDVVTKMDAINKAMTFDYSPSIVKKYEDANVDYDKARTIFYLFNRHGLTLENMPAYRQSIADEVASHAQYFGFQFDKCYATMISVCEKRMMNVIGVLTDDDHSTGVRLSLKISKWGNMLMKQIIAKAICEPSIYLISPYRVHLDYQYKTQYKNCITSSVLDACKQLVYDKYWDSDKLPTYNDVHGTVSEFVCRYPKAVLGDLEIGIVGNGNVMNAIVAFVLADYIGISN